MSNSTSSMLPSRDRFFSETRLAELADLNKEKYANASPFPHVAIDDFMSADVLNDVLHEFPDQKRRDWLEFDGDVQKKLAQKDEKLVGPVTRSLLYQFNSAPFVTFLESLTGIKGLIPDPHFWGGGLHQIRRNGLLKLHTDFTFHPLLKIDRRINVIVYLNKDWSESYGGNLELWDKDVSECIATISPIYNRLVVFNTNATSFHGHPTPLTCPPDMTRKSVALYYYTNGRPADEAARTYETIWKDTPEEIEIGRFKRTVAKFVPPIVWDAKKSVTKLMRRS